MKPDTEKVLSILTVHENNAANLIAILQDVQAEYNYLSEKVQNGYKVAIDEQLEDPKQAKVLVKREVNRVLTPGTL